MQEHLNFVIQGGSIEEVKQKLIADEIGLSPSPGTFKTPKIDNVFDLHSEFRQDSAGVQEFKGEQEEGESLRKSSTMNSQNRRMNSTSPVKKKAPPNFTPTAAEGNNNFNIDIEEVELERDEDESLNSYREVGD